MKRRSFFAAALGVLLSGTACAAPTGFLTAATTNPAVGDSFAVTVHLEAAPPFTCWGLSVRYDPTRLALISQAAGTFNTFVPDSRYPTTTNGSDQIRTGGFAFTDDKSGAGSLAIFTFEAISGGETMVTLEPATESEPFGLALIPMSGVA